MLLMSFNHLCVFLLLHVSCLICLLCLLLLLQDQLSADMYSFVAKEIDYASYFQTVSTTTLHDETSEDTETSHMSITLCLCLSLSS